MTSYVELHTHSFYSLLDGASSPEDLIHRAVELGMPALALTDHDNVYGAVSFVKTATAAGIKPIIGAEITFESGHHLTLLTMNEVGWRNLCTLITAARMNASKGFKVGFELHQALWQWPSRSRNSMFPSNTANNHGVFSPASSNLINNR